MSVSAINGGQHLQYHNMIKAPHLGGLYKARDSDVDLIISGSKLC